MSLGKGAARRLERIYGECQTALDLSAALSDFLAEGVLYLKPEDLVSEADSRGWSLGKAYACGALMELGIDSGEAGELVDGGNLSGEALDPEEFTSDPIYRVLQGIHDRRGSFILEGTEYGPYESFMCGETASLGPEEDFRIAYRIGFFTERFRYVQLRSGNRIWMSLSPYELRTMREPIARAHGKVLALGLGLGYYPLSCCLSDKVEKVTVIETSKDAIDIFTNTVLPRVDTGDKLEIVKGDGFSFLEAHGDMFDTVFIDTYHDEVDGFEAYRKAARYSERTGREVTLWIGESLRARFRIQVVCALDSLATGRTYDDRTVQRLIPILGKERLESATDVDRLLSDASLDRLCARL